MTTYTQTLWLKAYKYQKELVEAQQKMEQNLNPCLSGYFKDQYLMTKANADFYTKLAHANCFAEQQAKVVLIYD